MAPLAESSEDENVYTLYDGGPPIELGEDSVTQLRAMYANPTKFLWVLDGGHPVGVNVLQIAQIREKPAPGEVAAVFVD